LHGIFERAAGHALRISAALSSCDYFIVELVEAASQNSLQVCKLEAAIARGSDQRYFSNVRSCRASLHCDPLLLAGD
jgi:hypothetical protein